MADMTRPAEEVRSPPATTEHTPLLHKTSENSEPAIPTDLTARLYASHFLSTWNSRVFEFGAVLYLATIFPGTLLPVSVYAIARGAAAIAFSPGVGRWVDTGDRLGVVRVSVCACASLLFDLLWMHVFLDWLCGCFSPFPPSRLTTWMSPLSDHLLYLRTNCLQEDDPVKCSSASSSRHPAWSSSSSLRALPPGAAIPSVCSP